MQAFQLVEPQQPAELREVPVPEPGPGQVLVKVGGAGACHSDLHLVEAPAEAFPSRLPVTLGHENAGWVEKLGPGATGFAPGDPVIVYGPWGCGTCANCPWAWRTTATGPAASAAASGETTEVWLRTCSSRRRGS